MNRACEQKNKVNNLRLKSCDMSGIKIKPYNYEAFVCGMTYKDLMCSDFPVYRMQNITQVKPGRVLDVPICISSLKGEGILNDKSVKWRLSLKTKSGDIIVSNEGVMSVVYESGKITEAGSIKFTVPVIDALATVEIYLTETQSEKIISRNFFMFDIFYPKANTLKTDLTDIGFSGFDKKPEIYADTLCAFGKGKLEFDIKKTSVPGYEYGKPVYISLELCTLKNAGEIHIYANNIRINTFKYNRLKNECGFLTYIYNENIKTNIECGALCTVSIPPFVLKGMPNVFTIKLETDCGIMIFGRKSGHYPLGIEMGIKPVKY